MPAFTAEFLDRQARHWKPRTLETNVRIVRKDILPAFGHLTVDAVTVEQVRDWFASMSERPGIASRAMPVLSRMMRMIVHGVQYLLNKHRVTASRTCPSLKHQRVTVHRLRHTAAMDLLQAGVHRAVIALWLGHESGRDHPDLSGGDTGDERAGTGQRECIWRRSLAHCGPNGHRRPGAGGVPPARTVEGEHAMLDVSNRLSSGVADGVSGTTPEASSPCGSGVPSRHANRLLTSARFRGAYNVGQRANGPTGQRANGPTGQRARSAAGRRAAADSLDLGRFLPA